MNINTQTTQTGHRSPQCQGKMLTTLRSTAPVSMVMELPATWIQIFRVPPLPEPHGDTPCRRAAAGAPQATG